MTLIEVIFPYSFPKIDLHGFDRDSARVAINDFINDNVKMRNEIIVIIHGIGTGIIKEQSFKTLKQNKNVLEFKSDNFNRGCTIVRLKCN